MIALLQDYSPAEYFPGHIKLLVEPLAREVYEGRRDLLNQDNPMSDTIGVTAISLALRDIQTEKRKPNPNQERINLNLEAAVKIGTALGIFKKPDQIKFQEGGN